jgi:hypothetical protein
VRTRFAAIAGAAGIACVAAAAMLIAGPDTSGPNTSGPGAENAAYIVGRVAGALNAVSPDYVMSSQLTGSGFRFDTWASPDATRFEQLNDAGQVIVDQGISFRTKTTVFVSYQTKTWYRGTIPSAAGATAPPSPSCEFGGMMIVVYPRPATMAAQLRIWVGCGILKVGHTGVIDGVRAIALTAVSGSSTMMYWVNAATYLPVRLTVSQDGSVTQQDDLRWLPATPANLALLDVAIPAGFRQQSPG